MNPVPHHLVLPLSPKICPQMEGCSFLPSEFSGAGGGASRAAETGRLLLRQQQRGRDGGGRRRRLSSSDDTVTVMGLLVDEGLLLILLSVGLVLLVVGLCLLDRWMNRHPDVPVDHLLMPKRYRSQRTRRVQQVGDPPPLRSLPPPPRSICAPGMNSLEMLCLLPAKQSSQ